MADNLTQKIFKTHMVSGECTLGSEMALTMDHTLCQDATGTMVMLELEAMGLERVRTEMSVQYVDHNLLQADFKNADDHVYLRTVASRHGVVFSPPGNGISHQVHMERFGRPGGTLIGSDSHTPARGRDQYAGHRGRGPGCGPGHGRAALSHPLPHGAGG